jgi:hypothetical protein
MLFAFDADAEFAESSFRCYSTVFDINWACIWLKLSFLYFARKKCRWESYWCKVTARLARGLAQASNFGCSCSVFALFPINLDALDWVVLCRLTLGMASASVLHARRRLNFPGVSPCRL